MANKPTSLDDIFGEYETERLAKLTQEQAEYDKPENVAKRTAKAKEENERGVRLGWWDADGNPLNEEPEDEDEDEDEDEEEQRGRYDDYVKACHSTPGVFVSEFSYEEWLSNGEPTGLESN